MGCDRAANQVENSCGRNGHHPRSGHLGYSPAVETAAPSARSIRIIRFAMNRFSRSPTDVREREDRQMRAQLDQGAKARSDEQPIAICDFQTMPDSVGRTPETPQASG